MRLTLSEIRANAMKFSAEWKEVDSERAEAQTFWTELFAVFGIKRRSVASFEEKVKNLKGAYDRIDVFYSGVMIGEHKSRGQDLSKAASQAFDYVQSLQRENRASEIPQFIVVSDFETIAVYDLDSPDSAEPVARFKTAKLHENIKHLGFLSGYTTKPVDPEDPINIDAVEVLGKLHDALEKGGYSGHKLERFLVRVLFCLFADDTGIFENEEFKAVVTQSRKDGSDLGPALARFFKVLDQEKSERSSKLPEELANLPYVNGELFKEELGFADFDEPMRAALIDCCNFNWSRISPAVFGSLFQSIMAGDTGKKKRRQIGAHYTSERDIMKLVRSLFLDDLKSELESAGSSKTKLQAFLNKLSTLRFLDPACGCGNFLVVTYRELRELELAALLRLHTKGGDTAGMQRILDIESLLHVDVDQMYGIEIEEWPARIAEVAMWLIDHQMNQKVGEVFGQPVLRLPLKKSAKIHHGNALRTDWNEVLPAEKCSFVLGNPPFIGKHLMNDAQSSDMDIVWANVDGAGFLDYVTAWYRIASRYIKDREIRGAFVSTNSICQGEQAGIFWQELFSDNIKIHFAHRTFEWMSEARGRAHVHVVIVGFGIGDRANKFIYDYEDIDGEPIRVSVTNISPYLVQGPDLALPIRRTPVCSVPAIVNGNKPADGGHLIVEPEDKLGLLAENPSIKPYVRKFVSADEFLNGKERWVLWLEDAPANILRSCPGVLKRIEAVKEFRLASPKESTRRRAERPSLFDQIRQPTKRYILIPRHSSENRRYIPFAYFDPKIIISDSCTAIPNASLYHFGILTSEMHMAWVRQVCGRLKSDFRYSNKLVYNNFPWPQDISDKQRTAVEAAAQGVLDAREKFPDQTLADLYDPLAMPKPLRDAHKTLDRAVDKCYRSAPFTNERGRVEFLFDLYQKLTAPLIAAEKPKKKRGKK